MLPSRVLRRVPLLTRRFASYLNTAPAKPARGLTPPELKEDVHAMRCLAQLRSKDKNIEKYIYLSSLKLQDENMFYKLCLANMAEFTPLIYTPTVGDACIQFSHNYRRPEGLVSY
jgi:malate dehydrogenase (oxaloacetate-decarboxylating)(NADP+)